MATFNYVKKYLFSISLSILLAIFLLRHFHSWSYETDVWDIPVMKSSYKTELRKMMSHFELLTQNFL